MQCMYEPVWVLRSRYEVHCGTIAKWVVRVIFTLLLLAAIFLASKVTSWLLRSRDEDEGKKENGKRSLAPKARPWESLEKATLKLDTFSVVGAVRDARMGVKENTDAKD